MMDDARGLVSLDVRGPGCFQAGQEGRTCIGCVRVELVDDWVGVPGCEGAWVFPGGPRRAHLHRLRPRGVGGRSGQAVFGAVGGDKCRYRHVLCRVQGEVTQT